MFRWSWFLHGSSQLVEWSTILEWTDPTDGQAHFLISMWSHQPLFCENFVGDGSCSKMAHMEGKYKTNSLKYKTCKKTRSNVQMIPGDPPSPFPSCHSKDFWHLHSFPTFPRVLCLCPAFISTNGIQLETPSQPTQEPIGHLLGKQVRFKRLWGFFRARYTLSRNHLFFFWLYYPLETISALSFRIFRFILKAFQKLSSRQTVWYCAWRCTPKAHHRGTT